MEVPLLQGQPCIIQGVAQLKPPPPQGQILQPGQQQQPVLQTMMLDSQNKMVPVNSGVGQAAGNSLLQQQQLNQSAPAQMGRQVHLGENTNVTNQQMAAKPVGPQADSANAATGVDQIKKASGPPPIQAVQYKPKLIPGKLVSALLTYKIWHHSGFVFYWFLQSTRGHNDGNNTIETVY